MMISNMMREILSISLSSINRGREYSREHRLVMNAPITGDVVPPTQTPFFYPPLSAQHTKLDYYRIYIGFIFCLKLNV